MCRLWLCLALGFVAFLAVAHFTNMSEGMAWFMSPMHAVLVVS